MKRVGRSAVPRKSPQRKSPRRKAPARKALPQLKGFMFDLDGTLLLSDRSLGGYEILPGAIAVLTELQRREVPFVVLTNGSAYPPAEQAAKLRSAGLPVSDERMLTLLQCPKAIKPAIPTSRNGRRRILKPATRRKVSASKPRKRGPGPP